MEYKIGDEVLVKAKLAGCTSSARIMLKVDRTELFANEEDVIPVPDMTAEEAWEIAKNLFADYSNIELDEIFGKEWSFLKLMELTPQEAKAKIEAWESEKKIKVGDVVDHNGEIGIVTNTDDEEGFYNVLYSNGSTSAHDCRNLKKVGRHIDITGLLNQIGGTDA